MVFEFDSQNVGELLFLSPSALDFLPAHIEDEK